MLPRSGDIRGQSRCYYGRMPPPMLLQLPLVLLYSQLDD